MQNVLVTGANRGIGLALVQHLRARGDHVVAACRHDSPALRASGARVEAGVDVSDAAAVAQLGQKLVGEHLDTLWLNAGVLAADSLGSLDEDAFRAMSRQFEVNTVGPLRVARALLGCLRKGARIAIISSRMGSIADNGSGGYYGYRASKAAVNAVGKSLAVDLAPRGVAVFVMHPGYVATDMVGGGGDISPALSAERLLRKVDTLGLSETGTFWHSDGTSLPW